jgi:hypothetical protein
LRTRLRIMPFLTDLRDALAHVLWIGGGPQSGKTTLSRLLAGKWDLKIYNLDWHGVREHETRPSPAIAAFQRQSMDERWALPTVPDLVTRAIEFWESNFDLVLADLHALPRGRTIVAEGPRALPWCVAPVIRSPRQAIFLVPTPERREQIAVRRLGPGQRERFPGIVDRERALANIRARDAILDERTRASCEELGLRWEIVDGSRDLDASLARLEEHFAAHLPETPNV